LEKIKIGMNYDLNQTLMTNSLTDEDIMQALFMKVDSISLEAMTSKKEQWTLCG